MGSSTKLADAADSIKQGLGDGWVNDRPILDSLGRRQTVIVVAESAATFLLSLSNTDEGRTLNRFIQVEVLPSIRKTGSYQRPQFDEPIVEESAQQSAKNAHTQEAIYARP